VRYKGKGICIACLVVNVIDRVSDHAAAAAAAGAVDEGIKRRPSPQTSYTNNHGFSHKLRILLCWNPDPGLVIQLC